MNEMMEERKLIQAVMMVKRWQKLRLVNEDFGGSFRPHPLAGDMTHPRLL